MTTAAFPVTKSPLIRASSTRFYIGMAIFAILFSFVAFGSSLVQTSTRVGPLTVLLTIHGAVFFAWLLVFLAQTVLARTKRLALHRQLGFASVILATFMIVLGYQVTIEMARRGFDLSGDLGIRSDPLAATIFPLLDIVMFAVLYGAALLYRRRPAIHKRLMLLAVFGSLMPAPIAHLTGHYAFLRDKPILTPLIIAAFLALGAIHDRLVMRRIHPVSLWVALAIFALDIFCAAVLSRSAAWHAFASSLVR